MTDPSDGPPLIPDAAELRRVLSAIRYDQPLADSPLVDADAVWDVLLRDGVAPGARGRAWALGVLIHEIVTARLDEARRAAGVSPPNGTTSSAQLAADFSANSPELELWSALYYRYLDAGQLQAGEIAARAGLPRRDRKSTRLNSSHLSVSRMPSSA